MSIGDFTFSMITEAERKLPFYLVGVGNNFHQELDPHMRPDGYPHFQWIQVKSGRGVFNIDGETLNVETGEGILLFPDVPHEYYAEESPWIVNWFTFNGKNVQDFLYQININQSKVFSVTQTGIFSGIIHKALKLLRSTNPKKGLEASLFVYEFLIYFSSYAHPAGSGADSKYYGRLNPVLNYINDNFGEPVTIENMADVIGVTPQYLCQLFKRIIKQRPIEYLNNVRINKSKDILLKNPHMKIDQVASVAGYESSSYYCSIFKKTEGMSPGKFRELHLHQKYLSS